MAQRMHWVVFVLMAFCTFSEGEAVEVELGHGVWDGLFLYIPTSRSLIQKTLDDWNDRNSLAGDGPRLYLPRKQVFKDLNRFQHVVYVDFGAESFEEFERSEAVDPGSQLNTTATTLSVSIPFLAATPDGPPDYSLSMANFYDKHLGHHPSAEVVYPASPVDEITFHRSPNGGGGEFRLLNGSDEIRISFYEPVSCNPPTVIVRDEYIASFYRLYNVPYDGLHGFEFCDTYPRQNDYCNAVGVIREEAFRYSPDVCLTWYDTSGDAIGCAAICNELHITRGFLDYIPILDGKDVPTLHPTSYKYDFEILFKYPCFP